MHRGRADHSRHIALCTSDNESRHSLTIAMSCISLADILFLVKIARDRRSRQQ